ncbi:putative sensor histidine kinase NarS [Microbacterium lemovicicum]|uniref:histidine kinase n=2 Tax=Microbacterium lemovicicum TaxID=1072463 RepID=A0A3S9WA87_9MICO|nr:sensor histidine kinase [Microbacterium lemovicicum]AZS36957.1 putative sensor histidine kinase NarS [Microbacterium lemovicicum]
MDTTMTSLPPLDASAAPPTPANRWWRTYGEQWRRVPGNAVYLIAVFALAMTAVGVLASLFWTGVALIILVVGLPIIVAALLVARGLGLGDRFLLKLTGLRDIPEPEWSRDRPDQNGFWMTLTRPLRVAHYWAYLAHGMIVSPLLSIVSFTVTVTWISVAVGGLTSWVWLLIAPRGSGGRWGRVVTDGIPGLVGGAAPVAVQILLSVIAGVIFAFTLPWVLRGLTIAHHSIAESMLGRWRSDDLAAEVRAEAAARGAAVHAEDVALRRLERDIHDGPQQRLVRLQLDLAALERRAAAGDGDAAAELAREARGHAQAALDELRALSSGVAPPLLQDRGLSAALSAVAAGVPLSVDIRIDPRIDGAVSPEIARTVYFTVSELFTNTIKHAGATAASLHASLREPTPQTMGMLDVVVTDDGRGGARTVAGHGLAGLAERVAGLRGELVVQSPVGGPTTVGVHIPLPGMPA